VRRATDPARRRRHRVPARQAGPLIPSRRRTTRWRWGQRMGSQVAHLHLADGIRARDEHLVSDRDSQPCADVCRPLVDREYWHRGDSKSGPGAPVPRPGCPPTEAEASRNNENGAPDHRAQDRASGKPPTSSTTDASLSCRPTGPTDRIDLAPPRPEGPPT
jgi:hypothetical protein